MKISIGLFVLVQLYLLITYDANQGMMGKQMENPFPLLDFIIHAFEALRMASGFYSVFRLPDA